MNFDYSQVELTQDELEMVSGGSTEVSITITVDIMLR